VPLVARWPGRIRAGSVSGELVCLTDLLATLAEIHGARLPREAGEDSFSMLPALRGGKGRREAIVHHSSEGHFSIRKGDWKLHLGRGSGGFTAPVEYRPKEGEAEGELFDLRRDPREETNLYTERPEVVRELRALLEEYQRAGRSRPA